VVKKDARREPFDRTKLLAGVTKACEKRPVPMAALEELADSIERSLRELGEKENCLVSHRRCCAQPPA